MNGVMLQGFQWYLPIGGHYKKLEERAQALQRAGFTAIWHQHDYFDHANTVGWLRTGDAAHPGIMAVVLSNGADGDKWMDTLRPGARFRDATGHISEEIVANEAGWACFRCRGGSVSVWLERSVS